MSREKLPGILCISCELQCCLPVAIDCLRFPRLFKLIYTRVEEDSANGAECWLAIH